MRAPAVWLSFIVGLALGCVPEIPASQCTEEGAPCEAPGTVCRFGACVVATAPQPDRGPADAGPEPDQGDLGGVGGADGGGAGGGGGVQDAGADAGCEPSAERCNAQDDDCDGVVDEQVPPGGGCSPGIGACQTAGQIICEGGVMQCDVIPADPAPADACGDQGRGIDEDCDGVVDEGCQCDPGLTEACGLDVGACTAGERDCVGGRWGDCSGQGPLDEVCNGVDDDCDNLVDEGFGLGEACQRGQGICLADGQTICDPLGMRICSASPGEGRAETCDGLDEDCDGAVDEDAVSGRCETGRPGRCSEGDRTCQAGAVTCVPRREPAEFEQCEGTDEDCDGRVDEGIEPRACELERPGPCGQGVQACVGGMREPCRAAYQPQPDDNCDGVDDDCDGVPDDDFVAQLCIVDPEAECLQGGVSRCAAGRPSCVPDPDAIAEICNDVDDDCDGLPDEFPVGVALGDDACGGPAGNRAQWHQCLNGRCTQRCDPGWFDTDPALGCERGYTARQLNGGITLGPTPEFAVAQGPVPGAVGAFDLGVATGGGRLRLQVAGSTYELRGATRGVTYQRVRVYTDGEAYWLVSALAVRQPQPGVTEQTAVVGVVHMPPDGGPATAGVITLGDLGGVSGVALARDAQGWVAVSNGRMRDGNGAAVGQATFVRYRLAPDLLALATANAAADGIELNGGQVLQGNRGTPEDGPLELAMVGDRVVLMAPQRGFDGAAETVFVDVLADRRLYGFGALVTSSPRLVARADGRADFALISAGVAHWGLLREDEQVYQLEISRSRRGGNGESYDRVELQRVGGNPSLLASLAGADGVGACQLIHLRPENVSQLAGDPVPLFAPDCRSVAPMNPVAQPVGQPLMRLVVRDDAGYVVFAGELR